MGNIRGENPFGVPISEETLKQMTKYRGKTITREDLAREAMNMIHAEDKNVSALQHVLDLKADYGNGVTTLCLLYNATGDKLSFVTNQDWYGGIGKDPFPREFENGQWIAFLHCHPTSEAYGSIAACVYRGKNLNGDDRDFMVAWSTPWGTEQNAVYTEVREKDHFSQFWGYIGGLLDKSPKFCKDETDASCMSTVSIGGVTSPEFIGILQNKFSPFP